MRRLLNYFLRGLVLVAPIAITLYVCWIVFVRIDGWLGLPDPRARLHRDRRASSRSSGFSDRA
jgi:uncharacterized membrane protein